MSTGSVKKKAESDGIYYFYMRPILRYILNVSDLKAISQVINNICYYGTNKHLIKIRG